jgi:putative ABC transport system permease protein
VAIMMIGWTLKRAKASLLRDKFLTRIQVIGLALGVAVWVTAHVSVDTQQRTELPLSTPLYRVSMIRPGAPPPEPVHDYMRAVQTLRSALTWEEARSIFAQSKGQARARTFGAELALSPMTGQTTVRFADRELFGLFGLDFIAGGPWTEDDELSQELVAVLNAPAATKWFGSTDVVGKTMAFGSRELRIVGVIDVSPDAPRPYDISNFNLPEDVYLPVVLWPLVDDVPPMAAPIGDATAAMRSLEAGAFVQLWLSLPREAARRDVERMLGGQATLEPLRAWFSDITALPSGFRQFQIIATLALLASALNLVRLYMAKFQSRAREVCIHRAMGATRWQVFIVHLAETELVALSGTACGLLLGKLGLVLLNIALPDRFVVYSLDLGSILTAAAVGLLAGGLAGLYPAWRIGGLPPATFLRRE